MLDTAVPGRSESPVQPALYQSAWVRRTAQAAAGVADRIIMRRRFRPWEVRYLLHLVALDLAVGLAAGVLAFCLRFGTGVTFYNRDYLVVSMLLPLSLLGSLVLNRAYERRYLYVGTDEYQRVIRAGLSLTGAAAIGAYCFNAPLARGYVVIALPMATLTSLVARITLRHALHRARERGECLRRVVVAGHPDAVAQVCRQLRRERYHGLDVVGACLRYAPSANSMIRGVNVPVLASFAGIAEAVEAVGADSVIVLSCPELDGHALRRLAWRLERDDVDLIVASSLVDVGVGRTTIRPVDGLPLLHIEHPTLAGGRRLVKAAFDFAGASLLIALVAPLLALIAVAIRLDSAGPVFYRQTRVGRGGREFRMIKFRSMCVDADARLAELRSRNDCGDGLLFKMRDDPRVTRVGRVLRRYSLDELPQLFNVVLGSMSLVGPRPPLPAEVAAYPDDVRRRLVVKPGMTGLWQVSGRSDLSWDEAVRLDLRYVENWTLSMDLLILLRTARAMARASGAY